MKKYLVIFCLLVFVCAAQVFSEEDETYTREQWLEAKKENIQLQVGLRQEIIKRMQNEIEVWKQEFQRVDLELKEIKAKEKAKPEGKIPEKETKK